MIKKIWPSLWRQDYFLIILCLVYSIVLSEVVFRNTLLSISVDLAHHTALAEFLRYSLMPPPAMQPVIGEMAIYPSLSHHLAAILMNLGDDPLNAFVVIGTGAAIASWLLILTLTARGSRAGLIVFVGLCLIAIFKMKLGALIGSELISNFFYAEVVGDCVSIVAVMVAVFLLRRRDSAAALWFCLIAVFVVAGFHLLPAVRLVMAADLAFALTVYRRYRADRTVDWTALAAIILLPLSLHSNPTYVAMKSISLNNGNLLFVFPATPKICLAIALCVFAVAAIGLAQEHFGSRDAELAVPLSPAEAGSEARTIIFLLAAACAIGAIVQIAALTRHLGSEYAVKKHMFGMLTFGLAALSLLVGRVLDKALKFSPPGNPAWMAALVIPLHMLIVLSTFAQPNIIDVPPLIAITREVETLRPLLAREPHTGDPLFVSSNLPGSLNYYETVSILHSRRDDNVWGFLTGQPPRQLGSVSHILTRPGDVPYDVKVCREPISQPDVVVIDMSCYRTHPFDAVSMGAHVEFHASALGTYFTKAGWSFPEDWGIWTAADVATLRIPVVPESLPNGPVPFSMDLLAFTPTNSPVVTADIVVNGQVAQTVSIDASTPKKTLTLSVPGSVLKAQKELDIDFHFHHLASPRDLHLGADDRRLGFGLLALDLGH